jgi:hypothetical protein
MPVTVHPQMRLRCEPTGRRSHASALARHHAGASCCDTGAVRDETSNPDVRAASTATGREPPPLSAPPRGGDTGRPGKYQRTVGGLVGSIIAALGLIAAIWALTWFQHRDQPDPVPTIDYAAELTQARSAAPFGVLAPDPEPTGWRATSVAWDGSPPEYAWHLGFLAGAGDGADYVGVEQSNADPAEFVPIATPANEPRATVTVDGQAWQVLTSPAGETAMVLTGRDVTTVVTGTAPLDQLVAFAETLSAG